MQARHCGPIDAATHGSYRARVVTSIGITHTQRIRTYVLALATTAALPSIASAVDFTYNGFSTASYSQTDTDRAQVGFVTQPEAIDSSGTFKFDSKLGLQVTAKFNEMFSATVQGVGYMDLTSEWEPHLDWAYVRAQLTPSLTARAGAMRAPLFMFSDSLFIGYSNAWLRPPLEIYNQSPSFQLRGVDLNWRSQLGPVTCGLQPFYGESYGDIKNLDAAGNEQDATLHANGWAGLVAMAEYGSLMLRASYSRMEMDTSAPLLDPLIAGLNSIPAAFCPGCAEVAEGIQLLGMQLRFSTFGAQYDDGANLAITEYIKRTDNRDFVSANVHSAYVTYERRFGGFMPYVTKAMYRIDSPLSTDKVPAVGPLAPLAAGVNMIMGLNTDQDSYSIGIRYELPSFSVVKGALLKLQYDRIDTGNGPGNLNLVMPGYDGTVDMIGMSLHMIF